MTLPDSEKLWPWIRFFLEDYLPLQRGASPNTSTSYRTAFRQFKRFLTERVGITKTRRFKLAALEPMVLLEFLTWLQSPQGPGVGPATRNLRLAALRSFFRFLELHAAPEEVTRWQRLRQLPTKREGRIRMDYFELPELERVFETIPTITPDGFRDLALLAFLYNTGARASEAAGLRRPDLHLDAAFPTARFVAKGRVSRRCPLWDTTARLLRRYLEEFRRPPDPSAEVFVFINKRGGRMTRSGVGRRVRHYVTQAARTTPGLQSKKLSVHSIRHTTAIHLMESGADVHVVRTWLGHRSTRSTDRYLEMDLEPYRELLARFTPPAILKDRLEEKPSREDSEDSMTDWLDEF